MLRHPLGHRPGQLRHPARRRTCPDLSIWHDINTQQWWISLLTGFPFLIFLHTHIQSHPQYSFQYGVHDSLTGDVKSAHEVRDGDAVKGQYSLVEPDGSVRTVDYTADDLNGFNAVVSKSLPAAPAVFAAPAPVAAVPIAPVHQEAPVVVEARSAVAPAVHAYPAPVQTYAAAPVHTYAAAPVHAHYAAPVQTYAQHYAAPVQAYAQHYAAPVQTYAQTYAAPTHAAYAGPVQTYAAPIHAAYSGIAPAGAYHHGGFVRHY